MTLTLYALLDCSSFLFSLSSYRQLSCIEQQRRDDALIFLLYRCRLFRRRWLKTLLSPRTVLQNTMLYSPLIRVQNWNKQAYLITNLVSCYSIFTLKLVEIIWFEGGFCSEEGEENRKRQKKKNIRIIFQQKSTGFFLLEKLKASRFRNAMATRTRARARSLEKAKRFFYDAERWSNISLSIGVLGTREFGRVFSLADSSRRSSDERRPPRVEDSGWITDIQYSR